MGRDQHMFDSAAAFDQNIANWNVGRVTDMEVSHSPSLSLPLCCPASVLTTACRISYSHVFPLCSIPSFMGRDQSMFYNAVAFDQNLAGWDVGRVANIWVSHNPSLPTLSLLPLHADGTSRSPPHRCTSPHWLPSTPATSRHPTSHVPSHASPWRDRAPSPPTA